MTINGVGLLAACYLAGQLVGELLGRVINTDANVGGVGFGMVLLIVLSDRMKKRNQLNTQMQQGILFWSSMYLPVIVAMSSTQNVMAAFSGGYIALLAGIIPTAAMFFLIPFLGRLQAKKI